MAIPVIMPALELAQESGKIVAWRKKQGESVAKGDVLLEVETDKVVVEIEAEGDGVLAGLKAQEGDVIPVGETIAWIVAPGEVPPAEQTQRASGYSAAQPTSSPAPAVQTTEPPLPGGVKISPKARRLAREHGIDIRRLRPSGPDGVIVASDVEAAIAVTGAAAPAGVQVPGPVGRLMAERTARSWTTVPHFFVVRELDAGALVEALEQFASSLEPGGTRPTYTDLLIALVARVLARHPRLNASWTGEGIRLNQEVNVGVAVAVEEGVVAPVIHGANTRDLAAIALERQQLAERAKAGRLRPSDVVGATFTISNLGMYGVDAFTAIIVQPQAAILAVGRIAERVVPVEGRPGIRRMMTLTLACDHRVVDGARAAAFLNDVAEGMAEPAKWLR